MRFILSAILGLVTIVAAVPSQAHRDCDYSGVKAGPYAQGASSECPQQARSDTTDD